MRAWNAGLRRRRHVAVLALLIGALGWAPSGHADGDASIGAQSAREAPVFETVSCWSPGAATVPVRCGYLSVPESRERPNGRTIRIAVAILTPEGVPPATMPAPLVHLAGGPGFPAGLSGPDFEIWLDWYAHWPGGRNRALILVDQRGTGESEPTLSCDWEVLERRMRAPPAAGLRDPVEDVLWWRDYLLECRAPFDEAGIDVTAYNTAENAADFSDLRRALGIAQWDVWGASYGTELALELLRVDEAGTRSLILDAVSLYSRPEVVVGNVAEAFDRALTQVFHDCLLDEECGTTFPGLSGFLSQGLTWLNYWPKLLEIPGSGDSDGATLMLDRVRAVEALFTSMYYAEFVPVLPATVFDLAIGDAEFLGRLATEMTAGWTTTSAANLIQASTSCRATPRGEALQRLEDQERRYPLYAALWSAPFLRAVCAAWGSRPAAPPELLPVRSDVPALILGGRYDPVTPPEWGRIVAGWLPRSTAIEFPHLSHGSIGLDYCADWVAAVFLDRPGQRPEHPCLADLRPPRFVLPESNGED